jgi:hypothetical protein
MRNTLIIDNNSMLPVLDSGLPPIELSNTAEISQINVIFHAVRGRAKLKVDSSKRPICGGRHH